MTARFYIKNAINKQSKNNNDLAAVAGVEKCTLIFVKGGENEHIFEVPL